MTILQSSSSQILNATSTSNRASETWDMGLKENSYRVNIEHNGLIGFEPNIHWITSCKVRFGVVYYDSGYGYTEQLPHFIENNQVCFPIFHF